MALRIKELCKEKKITMAEIATRIGIKPIALSQSLNGNPTLSRLQEVAEILEVSIPELFDNKLDESVYGCLYIHGKPVLINNKDELLEIIKHLDA